MTTSTFDRRRFLGTLAALSAGAASTRAAAAASPLAEGPVTVVVPFTPGTTPDIVARLFGPKLAERLGQTFVVENKPGASGIIGLSAVAKAAPDGHTIASTTNTALTLPLVYASVPFDVIDSFTPLAMFGYTNFALCVHPSLKVDDFKQFVEYVKRNPGKVNYASPGKGTLHHLLMEMVVAPMGLKMEHVPYKGSAGATTDLLAGHVQAMFQPMHVAMPLRQEKRLVILGASRKDRDPTYPDIPPLDSVGLPGFDGDAWYAVTGPRGMKPELVEAYNREINRELESAEVKATLQKQGIFPRPMSPSELAALSRAEFAKWQGVIKTAGIVPE